MTDKVKKHFLKFVSNDKQDHEMWLEYNGQPMKWHFPIGVLYDFLVEGETETLPWIVMVHFDKFPETQIYRFSNKYFFMQYYIHQVIYYIILGKWLNHILWHVLKRLMC